MTRMKRLLTLLLLAAMLTTLSSCGISGDEAKSTLAAFLQAVEAGDFAAAEALLHPDRPMDLAERFAYLEQQTGLDFQTPLTVERYTGFQSAVRTELVHGSMYTMSFLLNVEGRTFGAGIVVVRNAAGYGVHDFFVNPNTPQ